MKPTKCVLLVCVIIAGCATTSDAMKVGDNSYQVSATASPARGGSTGARELALTQANKKCDSLGKTIHLTDAQTNWSFPSNSTVVVTFSCN